jgi:Trk-type K+ transport system membrane component
MSLLGGLILWAQEPIGYTDALFTSVSALSHTGLTSVDFAVFSTSSQVFVLIWIKLGGLIMVSLIPPSVRLVRLLWDQRKDKYPNPQRSIYIRVHVILIVTIICYMLVIEGGAFITIGSYLEANGEAGRIVSHNGLRNYNRWWWSLFYVVSSFQNAGFALFWNSLIPFADNRVILLTLAFVIVAGYNLWPAFLHLILWLESKVFKGKNKEAVELLLNNPRHFYFLLFPLRDTIKMLFGFFLITTMEYLIFFVEWDNDQVYPKPFGPGDKLLTNFYQVITTRNCGMNTVNIEKLQFGHLALLVVTMYISGFPFIMTVYTTQSLIVDQRRKAKRFRYQAKRLMTRSFIFLYIALIVILLIEYDRVSQKVIPNAYLAVAFEVSSAFGNVGLSFAIPNNNASYSGLFHTVSKLIIITIMLLGRHRGLPDSIDPAIYFRNQSVSFIHDLTNNSPRNLEKMEIELEIK